MLPTDGIHLMTTADGGHLTPHRMPPPDDVRFDDDAIRVVGLPLIALVTVARAVTNLPRSPERQCKWERLALARVWGADKACSVFMQAYPGRGSISLIYPTIAANYHL